MTESMLKIDNRKDILLLILLSPGKSPKKNEPITGRTRLIKLIYLFYEELASDLPSFKKICGGDKHNFVPYHFGPFSKDVYDDVQFLENADLIKEEAGGELSIAEFSEWRLFYDEALIDRIDSEEAEGGVEDYSEPVFRLTDKGVSFTEDLYNLLQRSEQRALREFKAKYNQVPLNTLLRYIYTTYPESAIKSKLKKTV